MARKRVSTILKDQIMNEINNLEFDLDRIRHSFEYIKEDETMTKKEKIHQLKELTADYIYPINDSLVIERIIYPIQSLQTELDQILKIRRAYARMIKEIKSYQKELIG